MDRRARELPGSCRGKQVARLLQGSTGEVEPAPPWDRRLVARLECYAAGQWGEDSKDFHLFVQSCAEAGAGRQETGRLLGTVVGQFGQYRRLLATTAVRAQAMYLLARVGLITPAAWEILNTKCQLWPIL